MRPVRRNDNLTTFMYRLPGNLGTSTSWNPQTLSRPVQELLYLFMVPRLRRLVAGLSARRPGFGLRSIHVRFLVDEMALGQVFLLVFCFPLTISFHQCFILIFIYVLLLPEGQNREASDHSSSQCSFGSRGPLDRKMLSLCFYLYICINILRIHIYNKCI